MPKQRIDDQLVSRMYLQEQKSSVEIARELQVSKFGVLASLRRSGVQMRAYSDGRTRKVFGGMIPTREWLLQAMEHFQGNALAVSRHYNFPYTTLIDWLQRFDIPRLSPTKRAEGVHSNRVLIPIEEAVTLSNQGYTYRQLSIKYGVSLGVVQARMKEVGHKPPPRRAEDPRYKNISFHKREILKQLGITACEICGLQQPLDFCHIWASSDGGPTEAENTLVLCKNHHHLFDHRLLPSSEFDLVASKVRSAESRYQWSYGA